MNRNILSILCLIALVALVTLYAIFDFKDTLFLGLLGSIATLYFGLLRTMSENDRIFKELFQEFNARYDDEFNDLLNELKGDESRALTDKEKSLIVDYFNLSAEEYLWRSKNRIDKKVWNAWKAGILENLKIPQVKGVYDKQILTTNAKLSYYGLV